MTEAALIVNTRSRRGRQWSRLAIKELVSAGFRIEQPRLIRDPRQLEPALLDAVKAHIPLIIVGGGDGTLSTAARHLAGSNSTLGILPLGTGNAFARDLQIKAEIGAAIETLVDGKDARVDLGEANGQPFVNVATVGLTTRIAEELTVEAKRAYGRFVYMIALLRAIARVKPFDAILTLGERTEKLRTLQVVIGSGRYHAGPFPVTPESSITDGLLSLYVLTATTRGSLLRYALALPGGRHVDLPEVVPFAATSGRLETRPVGRVVVDGEMKLNTPLDFRILPHALKVRVPPEFQERPGASS